MRIAHVITRMIIGGAQENTLLNCLDLIRLYGDEVVLFTGPSLGPEGDLLGQGRAGELTVRPIGSLRRAIHPWNDFFAARELRAALAAFRPDVVHTHSAKGGLIGRSVAWRMGVPAVVHSVHGAPFHDYQHPLAKQFFIQCERWAARRCHHLISVADAMTDLMVRAGVAPGDKFTTIPSGMEVQPFVQADLHRASVRQRYGFEDGQIVIGKVARMFHLKGHEDLIRAAVSVVAQNPQVRFLLVGDGVLQESLTRLIEQLGLQRHFVMTGLVPPDQVPMMIGAMDALVHTSYREGLARALPQALIAGRPVISYDIDGAREVVLNDQTGYLVAPGDLAGLGRAILRLANDGALRSRLGRAGQGRFTEPFKHETMTRRIRELYVQLLNRERAR